MQWIKTQDELPDIGVPVWAMVGNRIILLCRVYDDDRNWLWASAHGVYMYRINDDVVWDCEFIGVADECIVTRWQYLPELPQETEDQNEL